MLQYLYSYHLIPWALSSVPDRWLAGGVSMHTVVSAHCECVSPPHILWTFCQKYLNMY